MAVNLIQRFEEKESELYSFWMTSISNHRSQACAVELDVERQCGSIELNTGASVVNTSSIVAKHLPWSQRQRRWEIKTPMLIANRQSGAGRRKQKLRGGSQKKT
ncbi:hypothetical protein EG68_09432 [Paragonimus skrjabini miyazakii]|uniref:Uncharacterized protein n=1 Tax=Paragonimus skrjabini miyazakii TaxID=59628 RepID=A0A8S9YM70_9TREM|nr:hypothetical protein EG68_09432 [Paragonimus skrjabini miyazakii]